MAGEKNFENRLKEWLKSEGVYPLGEPVDRMGTPPCGYWEKRWGGGRYVKSGLPDMKIVVKGITLEVELKATNGTPSELQKRNLAQINNSGCFGFILYPEGFETFKKIVEGVKQCEFPTAGLISLINAHVFVMIYNLVATVANFIGNVFNDPVAAVARLFFDLADTVLSVLQALASAIDTIFGSIVWKTGDTSPLAYLIPAIFAELATATGFYYSKAKAENRIKLRKQYGPEIYNDTKEL